MNTPPLRYKKKIVYGGLGMAVVNSVATQYLAHEFAYSSQLGAPLIGKFYAPWKWLLWTFQYYDIQPILITSVYVGVAVSIISLFAISYVLILMSSRQSDIHRTLHGSAHYASLKELRDTRLFGNGNGVYVGGWTHKKKLHYLRHNGPEHIIAIAPTRSGKGVGLVIPTLLSWPHSVVVLDIKGENWETTSGWRQAHAKNKVMKFEPTSLDNTVSFNPLNEVRLGTDYEVADVQNIATMIVDPDGKGLTDHWAKTAQALLVGAILHVLYMTKSTKDEVGSLSDVASLLSDSNRSVEAVLEEMVTSQHTGSGTHPVVSSAARDMLNKSDNERSGVLSTAVSFLSLYRDPIIAKNTKRSSFKLKDLMSETPTSLYLVVNPSNKDRVRPLIRLVLTQLIRKLTEGHSFLPNDPRQRLLLLIDEFPSFGKLDVFQESLAYMAGYGIKVYLIVQDVSQLHGVYGRHESILSNCHIRVAFAPNNLETAKLLSEMAGTMTVVKKSYSASGNRFSAVLNKVTESVQEIQRPLMTPDECMRLPGAIKNNEGKIISAGEMLIFVAGTAPIRGTQILYFLDPVFLERSNIPAPKMEKLKSA